MCIDYDFVPKTWAGESCTGGGLNWSSPVIVEIAPVYSAKNMCMWLKHTKNQKGGGGGGWKLLKNKKLHPIKKSSPATPLLIGQDLVLTTASIHPYVTSQLWVTDKYTKKTQCYSHTEITAHLCLGLTNRSGGCEEELDVGHGVGLVEGLCVRVRDIINVHHLNIRVHS